MLGKMALRLTLVFAILLLFVSPVYADHTIEHVFDSDVNASFGASLRLRQEIWDDVTYLGPFSSPVNKTWDRNYFRLRLSAWGKVDIGQHFDIYSRITSEPKYYLGPYHPEAVGTMHSGTDYGQYLDVDEVIVDNLYATGKKLFNGLLEVKAGRQDFLAPGDVYGEGFLITDGTPGDGSRTFYFNAIKVRLNITSNNSVDFVYIDDPETDIFMPSIHPAISQNLAPLYVNNKKLLTTSDEQAFMIYSRNKFGTNFTFDPYYIYKIENGFNVSAGQGVPSPVSNPRLKLHTVGGRATFNQSGWRAKAELATQTGEYDAIPTGAGETGRGRRGLGGYAFGGYKFEQTPGKPEFDLGVVYLSGDDPNDKSKRSAWDPLFSRNPYWNELYIYTLVAETLRKYSGPIPGYWTNMIIYMIKGKVDICKSTNLTLTYQYLTAPEHTTAPLSTLEFSNSGKERGQLPTAVLNHKFTKNLDGFLQVEYFVPGNFYNHNSVHDAWFTRWQLNFKL